MVAAACSEIEAVRDAGGGDSPAITVFASPLEFVFMVLGCPARDDGGSELRSGAISHDKMSMWRAIGG
jgi:hypothetical protein